MQFNADLIGTQTPVLGWQETTMKVKVIVDRRAAIAAGNERYGAVETDLDLAALTPQQRDVVANCEERDGVTDLTAVLHRYHHKTLTVEPMPVLAEPDPIAWIDWHIRAQAVSKQLAEEEQAAEKRDADAYIDFALSVPVEQWVSRRSSIHGVWEVVHPSRRKGVGVSWPYSAMPQALNRRIEEALAERKAQAQALADARNAEAAANLKRAKQEQEAQEQRKQEQLAAWVRDRMLDIDQARYQDDFLPETEILDHMRDDVFAGLSDFPRYERIRSANLPHEYDCMDHGISCRSGTPEHLAPEPYRQLQRLREAAPEGSTVEARFHRCECDYCDASLVRRSALVTVKFGEFEFSREYALDDDCVEGRA